MTFQKIILYLAIIILIIILLIVGITLIYSKSHPTWPPMIPECPDYWSYDASGICVNIKDLGTCPPKGNDKHLKMDFNASPFTGTDGLCNKYNWANNCKVTWDGITYGVDNPCQTSS